MQILQLLIYLLISMGNDYLLFDKHIYDLKCYEFKYIGEMILLSNS